MQTVDLASFSVMEGWGFTIAWETLWYVCCDLEDPNLYKIGGVCLAAPREQQCVRGRTWAYVSAIAFSITPTILGNPSMVGIFSFTIHHLF